MATRFWDEQDQAHVRRWYEGNQDSASEALVGELEAAFAKRLAARHTMAVGSAMDGLQLALQACGVEPGDEVIVDSIVCFGGMAAMYVNTVPVFADIDPATYNMDPASLEARITPRTKAVICTHFAGLPCDMDRIMGIAREHGLPVIEDCAHALFSRWQDRYAGLLGDVGVFSFNHRKQLSTGQGGMMTFANPEFHGRVRDMLAFGRVPKSLTWNTAMPGIIAAVALGQLDKADRYVADDHRNAALLNEAIAGCPWLAPQHIPEGAWSAQHLWAATFHGDRVGIDLERFRQTCLEEGADYFLFGFVPYGLFGLPPSPAYRYPIFTGPVAYGKGCPTRCPHYTGSADYREGLCPQAEAVVPRMLNTTLSPLPQERIERLAAGLRQATRRLGP